MVEPTTQRVSQYGRDMHVEFEYESCLTRIIGNNYSQGPGAMAATTCKVVFKIIVPKNPNATPYFALISTGVHTHSSPPSRPREEDIEGILDVLWPMLTPGLTVSRCKIKSGSRLV